ncbi:unnamed protein product [Nippostrongylus brasiliensis]|uniref:Putative extracellular sulfatase Sulf-1 homolog (inferred by orthology to a C. elegans protein) n=1 Tax=Nippostrongylus brasiliensis TaxID=27835 RepID=A0A0N4Y9X1_NIPBR|nr:unnamed protein product [Nippostrongylus brasiliensis]
MKSNSRKKNVVLIITDDQDIELGSMNYMPKVSRIMKEKGTEFRGGFVSTPICCPSRSSLLTGMYVHNHNVHTNNHNCSGEEWSNYVPPGWDYWMGLVKNSKFYNYTVNMNGNRVKYGDEYEKDYFTDLVTNYSVKFIVDHYLTEDDRPFLTDSWNYAPNPDKQWLLQRTGKMEPIFTTLRDHNYLSTTYAFYTSDHGYHLGQFGLIKGKNMPYEFDIRVPYFIRGPGIMKNFSIREPVLNIDIAPTLIFIAGGEVPDHMDGRNLLDLIALKKSSSGKNSDNSPVAPWRDTVLIERGKMPKLRKIRDRFLNQKERYGKEMRLNEACSKPEWQRPCSGSSQTFEFKELMITMKTHLMSSFDMYTRWKSYEELKQRATVVVLCATDELLSPQQRSLENTSTLARRVWPVFNTYWCLRTVNDSENFLYCEFVTEFVSYYDLNEDPHQLHNIVYSLEMSTLERLSERLRLLRKCKGELCERFSASNWEQHLDSMPDSPQQVNS